MFLDVGELVPRHVSRAHRPELAQDLLDRALGVGWLDGEVGGHEARVARVVGVGEHVIREALLLADPLEEARAHPAPEERRQDHERDSPVLLVGEGAVPDANVLLVELPADGSPHGAPVAHA